MHEDIVFALGKLKDPSSTRILGETAVAKHSYLEHDEAFALGTKSIYALKNIGTPEAVRILGDLARNPNEALRKAALGRLKDIAKNGSTEAVRAEASAHLGP
jgi:HEAT repeat protein